jgi:hypothetical protein
MGLVKPSIVFLSLCLGLFTTAAGAALKPGEPGPDFSVDAALGGKEFKFSLAEALNKRTGGFSTFIPNHLRAIAQPRRMNSRKTSRISRPLARASLAFQAIRSPCSVTFDQGVPR